MCYYCLNMSHYTPTIGLEIHAELKTNSKMFSGSPNNPDEEKPNANINPIDLAHPGTLPTINKKALEHMVRIGLAVNGRIANFTEFDRKNYFYPDIPKGYQISQYKYPIVENGTLGGVDVTRVHLEEDTGTSKHDQGPRSLVDYNRAGVPLMELVTEPVIHSAEHAAQFARELQLLLRYLGASDANMEKGEMRVEINISLSDTEELGTKVEVKNINSFKAAERAINFEIERMTALLDAGKGDEIIQETRGWNENTNETFSQRKKESAHDYRYFPEPDLPKLYLHDMFDIESMKKELPVLPWHRREKYIEQGLNPDHAEIFVREDTLGSFYDEVVVANKEGGSEKESRKFAQSAANYITSDLAPLIVDASKENKEINLPEPRYFHELITMILDGEISSRGAKDILAIMITKNKSAREIADEHGLIQKNDEGELLTVVKQIINDNPSVVEEYRAGKETSIQFLVGQGMKATKGSANPGMLIQLLKKELG